MDEQQLIRLYKDTGVILTGHFLLRSGRHSDTYINKDAIFSHPRTFHKTARAIYYEILRTCRIDGNLVVTGPALAGAVLAAPISLYLDVTFVYPEKIEDKMVFRRGYDQKIPGKNVIVIEDVITTGGSVQLTIDEVLRLGGTPSGVFAIWNRSGWQPKECGITSLITELVASWSPEECPLCQKGISLQDPKRLELMNLYDAIKKGMI